MKESTTTAGMRAHNARRVSRPAAHCEPARRACYDGDHDEAYGRDSNLNN